MEESEDDREKERWNKRMGEEKEAAER